MSLTPHDIEKALAQGSELFDRPDSLAIVAEAFRIARRGYFGPHDGLLLGISDDHTGCLLRRAAGRGEADAVALLTKVPRVHITVASSEELATLAAGGVVKREVPEPDRRFRRDVRRALGDLITPETMMEIIDKFHATGHAAIQRGDPDYADRMLMALGLDIRARGFTDPDVGKIATFAIEAWDRLMQDLRGQR
jgi:hypothetical protein